MMLIIISIFINTFIVYRNVIKAPNKYYLIFIYKNIMILTIIIFL